ncbi:NHLP leader peptide family RiPP precursor [Desulfonema magnum]|uniref:Nitrile hydratase family protein n=1 Tax=Desulfonema magnum TaxID=45655 RepID=A0A975BH70_9BACT|nr:NHLP leader peptide family RiPP precursor [Desulfonema magnum]QTA85223.1 Nitrile hydratase family protein [Desulfonema magnum]
MKLSNQEIMEKVITRAWTDDAFKAAVLENPKSVLEREFGYSVPESVQLRAVEETALTRYLVLPEAGGEPDESLPPLYEREMSRRDMLRTTCAAAGKTLAIAAGISAWFSLSDLITRRALADEGFRKELTLGPKKTLKKEMGLDVPDAVEVKTLEDTAARQHLVLPYRSVVDEGELSDMDLEIVKGGGKSSGEPSCMEMHHKSKSVQKVRKRRICF